MNKEFLKRPTPFKLVRTVVLTLVVLIIILYYASFI